LQFREPTGLASIQLLRFSEILQIRVVSPNFERLRRTDQIATAFLEGDHDREEFSVVNFIIPLGFIERL
jgi:hypothetical protein